MKVFLFFLYVLYERKYYAKYESEIFIKKKLKNVVVVAIEWE